MKASSISSQYSSLPILRPFRHIISGGVTVISVTFYDNRVALRDENMLRQDVIVATQVTSLGSEIY